MSLEVAIPLGVGSSIVYGISIVVQHGAAHTGTGEEDAHGLLRLLRDPRWLLAIAGDFVGLHAADRRTVDRPGRAHPAARRADAAGRAGRPASLLGGPRPGPGEYPGMAAVSAGLAGFIGMVGRARHPQVPDPWAAGAAVADRPRRSASALCLAVRGRGASLRGAVLRRGRRRLLRNARRARQHRVAPHRRRARHSLLTHPSGIVTLAGIVVLGTMGIVLTQLSFQVGALAATLPANLSTDPLVAVVLGVVLLRENLPHGPAYLVGYLLCLGLILYGTIRARRADRVLADALTQ